MLIRVRVPEVIGYGRTGLSLPVVGCGRQRDPAGLPRLLSLPCVWHSSDCPEEEAINPEQMKSWCFVSWSLASLKGFLSL